jgi:hypothetical protein
VTHTQSTKKNCRESNIRAANVINSIEDEDLDRASDIDSEYRKAITILSVGRDTDILSNTNIVTPVGSTTYREGCACVGVVL